MLDASSTPATSPQTTYLADYRPPPFLVDSIELDVDIGDEHTIMRARSVVRRNPASAELAVPLTLDGDELELIAVSIDGWLLTSSSYLVSATNLVVATVPAQFTIEIVTRLSPNKNTKLMGLYQSKDGLFTQCEAEGFRRITYFLDRPDVMAKYSVTLHGDSTQYPQLLSNGNPVERGDHGDGRHWVKWVDPHPKPCYLFALVAAKLDRLERASRTRSGRAVSLQVFVEPGKLDQAGFALDALERSMKWDEAVFGLELDLDQYMIVAVGDFNMGAMENKGLNIFNTKYVLARPDTATDTDYQGIDRVVAHEYFHNWTGNRVTCRDWFQLSLKEGLTVFRDQEYGADTYSRPVQRIQEVRTLRAAQFPEDAGPMAHAIRPSSYIEISNFYTATVYEKGAEVVRMIHTLIGPAKFRQGMDLYFKRHDGQAVRTEDFVQAMADASTVNLDQFRRWYEQAGTPVVIVESRYDQRAQTYTMRFTQSTPATPGQPNKLPKHIPFTLGLVGDDGVDIRLQLRGESAGQATQRVLSLTESIEERVFVNVAAKPVPSLARDFSAPIVIRYDYSEVELTHLMAHDSDLFNRWEAGQRLATRIMLRGVDARRAGVTFDPPQGFIEAVRLILAGAPKDPAFAAEALSLPSEGFLAEQMTEVAPELIQQVRIGLRLTIAQALRAELLALYQQLATHGTYSPDAGSIGRRTLRNLCLAYLLELNDAEIVHLAVTQFDHADNMTDAMGAVSGLAQTATPARQLVLDRFYAKWQHEALVVDKWLGVQATSRLPGTIGAVRDLMKHPAFDIKNPNKVRAVISSFCQGNLVHFHAADGSGYAFGAEQVLALDPLNPQVAARLARAFDRWKKFDPSRRAHAQAALERIRGAASLSKDVFEVVNRSLA